MTAILTRAGREALKLPGMASQKYRSLLLASYEIHCRHYPKLSFDVRCPACLGKLCAGLGLRFWALVRHCLHWVSGHLFEASADTGEWFAGLLDIELSEGWGVPRPPSS